MPQFEYHKVGEAKPLFVTWRLGGNDEINV